MPYKPHIISEPLPTVFTAQVHDQNNQVRDVHVAGESALTICLDGKEIVTLMTLGTHPAELVLGYLYNQKLLSQLEAVESLTVDWEREKADVVLRQGHYVPKLQDKISHRIVTSGCGQGTVFSCTLDKLYEQRLPKQIIKQSTLYVLLNHLAKRNEIYRQAGAVHACALCEDENILVFVEDVGRHNAVDIIAGIMLLKKIAPENKIFYTTGRLSSEMLMKMAFMRIAVLLSRSGVTHMGLELARDLNITMIARAKVRGFLAYTNAEYIDYDAKPLIKK